MTTLVVPIECEALVANRGVMARDALRWWQFNYSALNDYRSPEPMAFDRSVTGQTPGVYLHWTLPAALRRGGRDSTRAGMGYPLVPNRWLVLRVRGVRERTAVGWVLESDCPLTTQVKGNAAHSAQWLVDDGVARLWRASGDPRRTAWRAPTAADAAAVASIGIAFDLRGWEETAASSMFLTAIAPANPLFAGYVPHHGNVFTFHDTLDDVAADVLSYYVVGWYSDPARDIAATAPADSDGFAAWLAGMGWQLSGGGTANRSAYAGGCFEIDWQRDGAPPAPDPLQAIRDTGRLNVAVGNTTIDAFSAMIGRQVTEPGVSTLLRALNYDLLGVLNQVNGDALLQQRIRKEWFGSGDGGTRWTIAEINSDDGDPDTDLTAGECEWLAELNKSQRALDRALSDLFALQWTVNALWYKRNWLSRPNNVFPAPPSGAPTVAQLDEQLDPARANSAAARLVAALSTVSTLMQQVPQPDWTSAVSREHAFQAGIAAFARARKLDPGKRLKAAAMPRFWRPNNPVVAIAGVQSPYSAAPDRKTPVRLDSRKVTGFSAGGKELSRATAAAAFAGLPDLTALPAFVAPLVDELFLLDRASAAALAAAGGLPQPQVDAVLKTHPQSAYAGVLPAYPLEAWRQPWQPLLMEWRASYVPLDSEAAWHFDGTDYHATGADAGQPTAVGGISLLSPHAQFTFGSRLKAFLDQYGDGQPVLQEVYRQIAEVHKWEFLTQELSGFNDTLSLRDRRPYRRPTPDRAAGAAGLDLADALGYNDTESSILPKALRGRVGTVPLIPNGPAAPFQGVRGGQFNLIELMLYDRFGRVLNVLSSSEPAGLFNANNFPAVVDAPMVPAKSVLPAVRAVVELPPRLIQAGRLDMQLLDNREDGKRLADAPEAVPVCGWVLPNHLDRSLLLYGPDGASLGELRLLVDLDGVKKSVRWLAPPHGRITAVEQLGAVSPHLLAFVTSARLRSEANFNAFMDVIDSTLWTIDPLGGRADQNMSVLVGRPLALVRARLQLQMEGHPFADTGWRNTLNPPTPDWLERRFCIRLGDQATRQDGTIGYFHGTDYDVFHSVVPPDAAGQTYIEQIGPVGEGSNYLRLGFKDDDHAFITLLMDPRAAVHASTGLFPVKTLELPHRFVDRPLANMEAYFRMGPILTAVQSISGAPGDGASENGNPMSSQLRAIAYPLPAEQNGRWSWWEAEADRTSTGYEVVGTTADAKLLPVPNTLREGIFQLTIDLKKVS